MAEFSNLKLTNVGINLQTKVQAGATLIFSRLGLGNGTLTFPDDVPAMTALVNEQMPLAITEVKKISNTEYKTTGIITPAGLPTTGFNLSEIGLFATDPDDGEILYGVIYAGVTADYIPSSGSGMAYDYVINIVATVGDTDAVTVIVDVAAAASKQDIVDHADKQLDPTDTDTAKERHLSNAQGKVWQDHVGDGDMHVTLIEKAVWSDHALDETNPHNITTSQIGAETPAGAQGKVNTHASDLYAHGSFPAGTSMVFNQASAPIGWTKKTDWGANASLIVGNTYGSGGSDSPTSWTTNLSVNNHALTSSEMCSHTHGDGTLATNTTGAHTHTVEISNGSLEGANRARGTSTSVDGTPATSSAGNHSHTISGSTGSAGSGSGHNHGVSQDTYTPKYQIMIAATRD